MRKTSPVVLGTIGLILLSAAVIGVWLFAKGDPSPPKAMQVTRGGSDRSHPAARNRPLRARAGKENRIHLPKEVRAWIREFGEYGPGYVGDLREPLDPNEMRDLVENPKKDRYRLKVLICRAAGDRDTQFRYLLDMPELREDPWIDLPIAAYAYSINRDDEAFDYLLDKLAAEPPGSDSDVVLVLSFLNEWERSIPAVLKHFQEGTDGAGGIGYHEFWATRKYLYPLQFHRLVNQPNESE